MGGHPFPAKSTSEWNTRRLVYCGVFCFGLIIMITCAILGKTLSAILAFALLVVSFGELLSSQKGEIHSGDALFGGKGIGSRGAAGNVERLNHVLCRTSVAALSLDKWVGSPDSHTANKVLLKALIKEYLALVARLQKYEPDYGTGNEKDPCLGETPEGEMADAGMKDGSGLLLEGKLKSPKKAQNTKVPPAEEAGAGKGSEEEEEDDGAKPEDVPIDVGEEGDGRSDGGGSVGDDKKKKKKKSDKSEKKGKKKKKSGEDE